jgi:hypothetical protein
MRIAPAAPRANAGKALDNSRAAQLAQVCGGPNSHPLPAPACLSLLFFDVLRFPRVTATAQAPPGNVFTTNLSAPAASSAASTLPPAAAAASLPSFDSQEKPVLVFEDVCFSIACAVPAMPLLCPSLSCSPTLFQRLQTTCGRSLCSWRASYVSRSGCPFLPPSPLLHSFFPPKTCSALTRLCNTLCMCNISGVRNKDPRRRWLSIVSIAFCYLALVVLVRR